MNDPMIEEYESDTKDLNFDAPTRGRGRPRSIFTALVRTTEELAAIELTKARIDQQPVETILGIFSGHVYATSKNGELLTTPVGDIDALKIKEFATAALLRPYEFTWTTADDEVDLEFEAQVRQSSRTTYEF